MATRKATAKTKRITWADTQRRLAAWSRSRSPNVFIYETPQDLDRLVRLVLRMQRDAARAVPAKGSAK